MRTSLGASLWSVPGVVLAMMTAACSSTPSTEVMLVVDATPAVSARADALQVEISGASDRMGPFTGTVAQAFGPPATGIHFPRRFALVPANGDATRFFQAVAIARAGSTVIATGVLRSTYAEHRLLELHLTLDDAQCPMLCPMGQTCRAGRCEAIFVDPVMDAGTPVADGALDLPDGATLPDAIVDGGADATSGDGGDMSVIGCTADLQCDDMNACNGVEHCALGTCLPASVVPSCDDSVGCTHDDCDPMTGACSHRPDNTLCTSVVGGICNATSDCQYPTCTNATCIAYDPATCTDGTCSGNTCNRTPRCSALQACCDGMCVPLGCNDGNGCTTDSCGAGGCHHDPNFAACVDADPCTVGDSCAAGSCVGGMPMNCDDGNLCTDDSCSGGVCQHLSNFATCTDDMFSCTGSSCDSTNVCVPHACDSSQQCCGGSCRDVMPPFDVDPAC